MITLKIIKNPFEPFNGEIKQVPYVPGQPVFDYTRGALMLPEEDVAIIHNCRVIEQEEFYSLVLGPDDFIAIMPVIGKNSDGGKNIVATVAMIVLMMYAPQIGMYASQATGATAATAAAVSWNFWGWAAYMGTIYAGGQLINQWFGTKKDDEAKSPTYTWNCDYLVGEKNPIQVVFGRVRVAGQPIAQHVITDGDNQYLNMLIEACEGPCDYIGDGESDGTTGKDNCTGIKNIKIDDNDLSNYTGIKVHKRAGLNDQSLIPNFENTRIEQSINVELENDSQWHTFTTTDSTGSGLEVLIMLAGLYNTSKDGTSTNTVRIEIQHKLESASDWVPYYIEKRVAVKRYSDYVFLITEVGVTDGYKSIFYIGRPIWLIVNGIATQAQVTGVKVITIAYDPPSNYNQTTTYTYITVNKVVSPMISSVMYKVGEIKISGKYMSAIYRTYTINTGAIGKYDIRCRCIYKDHEGSGDAHAIYWSKLSQIIYDDFTYPNCTLLSVQALGSDLISRSTPKITYELTRSYVWVWNPDTESYEQKAANNPAWAAYWMLHRVYYMKNINTGEWEYIVRGIPASRIVYSEFEAWASFCAERELEVNIYFDTIQRLREALEDIEDLGRGKVIHRGTRYGCIFDAPAQKDSDGNIIPAQMFNMSNTITDSFSEQFVDISDRATAIDITYYDRNNNFKETKIQVPADGLDDVAAQANPTQTTWKGCTSYRQAWREGKYRLRLNNHLKRTGSWQADIDAIVSSLGQVVTNQNDVPGWGLGGRIVEATVNTITLDKTVLTDIEGNPYYDLSKTYQVLIRLYDDTMIYKTVSSVDSTGTIITLSTAFETIPEPGDLWNFGEIKKVAKPFKLTGIKRSGGMKYSLVGLEYVDEVYTEAEEIPEIKYSYLDVIFEVENLAVKEETFIQGDGTIVCRLNCSWTVPTGKRADSFRAFYSTDNQQNWTYYETTIANAKSTYIDNVQAGQTYYVKIVVVKGVVVSTGIISNPVTIVGKDTPPSDLASLTVIQQENILKITVVVSGNDPDIWGFEIRLGTVGAVWEIATPLKQFRDYSTTIDVTQSGVQTFLAKAIDNSRNYSTNAVSYTTTVYNMSSRFNIYSETQDLTKATFTGMFWSKRGWQIDSVEKIGDFQYFAQIFETPITLRTDASVLLPVVDLGQNIIPETYIELFLTVLIDYANGEETSSEIQYQTSWDNVEWSQWSTLVNHQFFGRFLRVKILPLSVDGVTNVDLKSVSLKVDTIAITETIGYTSVSDSGSTRIYLKHKFFETPVIQLFSYDSSNRQCIHEIVGGLPIRGEDGTWYFDVRNWNGEIQVAGNVYGNAIGY